MQPARVGVDAGRREPSLQGDPGRLELPGQAVGRGGGQAGQVAGAAGQVQGGGGGQGLQVADHAGQPQHLIAQRRQLIRGRLGDPVEQGLVPGLQDGDRGAQLVGDVGHQVAAQLVLPVARIGHLVERGGQLAQLAQRDDVADPGGASRATAASATERKASASRKPSVLPRDAEAGAGPAGGADADADAGRTASVIAGQAQPVPAAQDRLHDLRPGRVLLDLAAQVLHVRVDGALVPLELIPADPVDQLEP